MNVILGPNNVSTMLKMYRRVMDAGEVIIRGEKCRNVHNMCVILNTEESMLTSFKARHFNLDYAKKEWQWYLGADKMDDSIEQHAKIWAKIKQEDGSYFSNYGQYIFGDQHLGRPTQFEWVIQELKRDQYSRRASVILLKQEHLFEENKDVVCTYSINFTIQADQLLMTVMMRSNDVIFGFTNDSFCFSQLYEFVFQVLKRKYPRLQRGTYTHFVNSMHVYERHYKMISAICADMTMNGYDRISVPRPSAEEVIQLVKSKGMEGTGEYSDWLRA
jgi:thymidylate synthase